MDSSTERAAELILGSKYLAVFTGAGISVESGVPPFRGKDGIWSRYDPSFLEIGRFRREPERCWPLIKKLFYDFFGCAVPNPAHNILARWQKSGLIKDIITQNIDNLHTLAGSERVWEFHGNSRLLVCMKCQERFQKEDIDLESLPPFCGNCGGLLKPDFIFFGEEIPVPASNGAFHAAERCDTMMIIGSTGEVVPAAMIPWIAKNHGAQIIEINPEISTFTGKITDIHLRGTASEVLLQLDGIIDYSD